MKCFQFWWNRNIFGHFWPFLIDHIINVIPTQLPICYIRWLWKIWAFYLVICSLYWTCIFKNLINFAHMLLSYILQWSGERALAVLFIKKAEALLHPEDFWLYFFQNADYFSPCFNKKKPTTLPDFLVLPSRVRKARTFV